MRKCCQSGRLSLTTLNFQRSWLEETRRASDTSWTAVQWWYCEISHQYHIASVEECLASYGHVRVWARVVCSSDLEFWSFAVFEIEICMCAVPVLLKGEVGETSWGNRHVVDWQVGDMCQAHKIHTKYSEYYSGLYLYFMEQSWTMGTVHSFILFLT